MRLQEKQRKFSHTHAYTQYDNTQLQLHNQG